MLDFFRPGKPTDDGHIESFTARLRDERLNVNLLKSKAHAKTVIEARRHGYKGHRPHDSPRDMTSS